MLVDYFCISLSFLILAYMFCMKPDMGNFTICDKNENFDVILIKRKLKMSLILIIKLIPRIIILVYFIVYFSVSLSRDIIIYILSSF